MFLVKGITYFIYAFIAFAVGAIIKVVVSMVTE